MGQFVKASIAIAKQFKCDYSVYDGSLHVTVKPPLSLLYMMMAGGGMGACIRARGCNMHAYFKIYEHGQNSFYFQIINEGEIDSGLFH